MITSRRMKDGSSIMDIEYTTKVPTPHVPWARPYVKGPIKAFFLPSVKGGRDFVELMQRLDLDVTAVTHDRAWDLDKWGFGDFYDRRVRIWEYETVYAYMVDALTSDEWYDVLVLQSVNGWGFWPQEARRAIVERVKNGAGLVLVRPFEGEHAAPELAEVSPLVNGPDDSVDEGGYPVISVKEQKRGIWRPSPGHYITANIPFDALYYDEIAYYPYEARGEIIIEAAEGDPIAAVREVGKGRSVAFGWYNRDLAPQHAAHIKPVGGLSSNSDFWVGGFSECPWRYVEYVYAMLARAVVWASGKTPQAAIELGATTGERPVIEVTLSGRAKGMELDAVVRNEWGEKAAHIALDPDEVHGGRVDIEIPSEALGAGAHFGEVIARRNGKSVDWAAVRFDMPRRAAIESITPDAEIYEPGAPVTAEIEISGEGGPLRMEAAIVDAFDRVTSREYCDIRPGVATTVTLSRDGVMTPQMWVRVQLTEDGRKIDQKLSVRLTAVPDYDRNLHDAELVVAQYDRGRGDYVEAIRRQLMEFGATNGYYGYSKILAESGAEGGGIYWYHRAPYIEQKEKYLRTGNKKYLERKPCLNDPGFLKEVHEKIVEVASQGTRYAPLSYYVQDEGSLTCYRDQLDLCFGKHTLAAMRKWLKKEYRDIRRLNSEWGTSFSSWEKVTPMTIDEARAHGNLAPWADHRTFMEMAFADYFRLVRDSVREVDPDARIRLSGCQVSEPYTGMDYWRLHQVVEYFEAYGGGNQYEFHQSFAGPRTILGTWIGYGQKGRVSNHKIWDAYFHQIRLMSVFWEFAVINPDLTLSGSAEDMASTWKDLHGSGVSRMLFDAERDNSRIAVHYSYPSIHAAYGREKMERFNQARQGWLNILQDMGFQQSFLSRQQIENGDLIERRFKLLIMPMSYALSDAEAREIKKFVKAGGRVIGDLQTAVMDDHCKMRTSGALDDVFGIRRFNMRNEPFFINREPMRSDKLPEIDARQVQDASCRLEEPGVREEGGEALFHDDFSHYVPGFVINSFGKGRAAYLNFGVDVCAGEPDSAEGLALKKAIGEVIAWFGVKPIMQVTGSDGAPLDHVEMFGYRDGAVRYFAMLRENVGSDVRVAYDGIVHGAEEGDTVAEKIMVSLPVSGHVYDCIAKQYHGEGSSFETSIEPAEAKVFAVYPYRVKDMDIEVEPGGNLVSFAVEVLASKGTPKLHTIVMDVMDSEGVRHPLYSRNLQATRGKVSGSVEVSLEGESGIWKLAFTEAASGISKSVEVMVP